MSLCLTCSSSIPPQLVDTYKTPCCARQICVGCLLRNPRLREYDPCLQCGDLTTASGTERARRGRQESERRRAEAENIFSIEDEDEDEEEHGGEADGDKPPPYQGGDRQSGSGSSARSSIKQSSPSRAGSVKEKDEGEEEMEVVEVRHPVSRSDTILSIARKYAADPHEILKLNSLPPSTLSSQPHLLRTRRTLLISTRRIPKRLAPSSTLFDDPNASSIEVGFLDGENGELSPAEAAEKRRRERERAVKRFQLMTKSVDPGVGAAYLSLSELDESSLDDLSSLEIDAAIEASQRSAEEKEKIGGKRALPGSGNREQRALDAFYEDEQWEASKGNALPKRVEGGWRKVGDGSRLGVKV